RPVAPLHPAPQHESGDLAVRAHLPGPGDVGDDLGTRVVPVEQLVVLRGAVAVGGIERAREAATPGAPIFSDLAQRLDDQWVLPDALLYRGKLAGLHQIRECRRLLEAFRV